MGGSWCNIQGNEEESAVCYITGSPRVRWVKGRAGIQNVPAAPETWSGGESPVNKVIMRKAFCKYSKQKLSPEKHMIFLDPI